ncbi:hypothetical protein KAJ27_06340, partial [bacterium]|nr:hypothetical protein [bacterium]
MKCILQIFEKTKKLSSQSKWILLLVVLMMYIFIWVIHPKPFSDSDPLLYAKHAYDITQGKFFNSAPTDHPAHRLSVILPVSAFYKTFGINTTTTYVWSLINALIIISAIWFVMPTDSSRIMGVLLAVSAAPLFKSATSLLPDIVATTFMFLSSIFLYYRKKVLTYTNGWLWFPMIAIILLF